jgi:type IV secretory pathway TrbD component
MAGLRRSPFHRVLHRPNLILGGERELVMFTALLSGGLAVSAQNWVATLISSVIWLVCMAFLRMMAKADPYMSHVYLRQLRYGVYLPARSRPYRTR